MSESKTIADGTSIPKRECSHGEVRRKQYEYSRSVYWKCVLCDQHFYESGSEEEKRERRFALLNASARIFPHYSIDHRPEPVARQFAIDTAEKLLEEIEKRET